MYFIIIPCIVFYLNESQCPWMTMLFHLASSKSNKAAWQKGNKLALLPLWTTAMLALGKYPFNLEKDWCLHAVMYGDNCSVVLYNHFTLQAMAITGDLGRLQELVNHCTAWTWTVFITIVIRVWLSSVLLFGEIVSQVCQTSHFQLI